MAAVDAIGTQVAVAVVPQSAAASASGVTVALVIVSDVIRSSSSVIRKIHEIVHMSGKENGIGTGNVPGAAIISAVEVAPRHQHVVMQHAIINSSSSTIITSIRVNMARVTADQTWWT